LREKYLDELSYRKGRERENPPLSHRKEKREGGNGSAPVPLLGSRKCREGKGSRVKGKRVGAWVVRTIWGGGGREDSWRQKRNFSRRTG